MSTQVLTSAKVWVDKFDLSSDLNALAVEAGIEAVENTTFGIGTKVYAPGLKTVKASYSGLLNLGTGNSEEFLAGEKALLHVPTSFMGTAGVEGDPAYTFRGALVQIDKGGQVGQILKLTASMEATDAPLVFGNVLLNGVKSAGGNGTVFNLGAVGATESLYAALHVFAYSGGGALTAKVQSAALVGFGSPTDRLTFAAKSAVGSDWQQAALGALSDAFWRVTWTFTGTSVTFAVIFGAQAQ